MDTGALAQAFINGQINPSYPSNLPTSIDPTGQVEYWPVTDFPDLGTANQIASLLGQSVSSQPVAYVGMTQGIPTAYYIGSTPVSAIIAAGQGGSLCQIALSLANTVGIPAPSSCAVVNPNSTYNAPVTTTLPGNSTLAPGSTTGIVSTPVQTTVSAPTSTTSTSVNSSALVNTSQNTNNVAGGNTPTLPSGGATSNGMVVTNGDVLTEDSLGLGLPNWAYGAIAAVGLILVMDMGKR